MECSSCDEVAPRSDEVADGTYESTTEQQDEGLIESSEDAQFEGKPTADVTCDDCGHDEAWYTIKQTASADEPPTRFFKCKDCGNRWREYS